MASYFDVQPHSKTSAASSDGVDENAFGRPSLLSPQVTSILDELEGHSSSSSGDNNEEGEVDTHSADERDERKSRTDAREDEPLRKARTSPLPGKKRSSKDSSPRSKEKPKQPHFARFHSLRSMLFQSNIERSIQTQHEETCAQVDAAEKWKDEHDKRRGLNRSPTGSPPKDGLAHRVGNKLRRLTSKDVPTMAEIEEDDRESTASSDDDGVQAHDFEIGKKRDERHVTDDDESIHHSDVEELVRWVSRRDPPSDGEARGSAKTKLRLKDSTLGANDSGHESLGQSDVEDLVHWVSRKPGGEDSSHHLPADYSDASTESDSEGGGRYQRDRSRSNGSDDEDVDELVRWVSRREGSGAGPVKKQTKIPDIHEEIAFESDHSELRRWITKEDQTSGESDIEASAFATAGHSDSERGRGRVKGSLSHKDVDELVRWVSQTNEEGVDTVSGGELPPEIQEEQLSPKNTLETSTERPPARGTLTHDDVDDLVRWVSRRHDSGQDNPEAVEESKDMEIPSTKQDDEKKKVDVDVEQGRGSLAPEDVDELVRWVSRK